MIDYTQDDIRLVEVTDPRGIHRLRDNMAEAQRQERARWNRTTAVTGLRARLNCVSLTTFSAAQIALILLIAVAAATKIFGG